MTEHSLVKGQLSGNGNISELVSFQGSVTDAFLETSLLTVLVQTSILERKNQESDFVIKTVNLTDFHTETMCSFSCDRETEDLWCLRASSEQLVHDFWTWCGAGTQRARSAEDVFVVGDAQTTLIMKNNRTYRKEKGYCRRCHFQRKWLHISDDEDSFFAHSFGSLSALLRAKKERVTCHFLEAEIAEMMVTSDPEQKFEFVLTENGDLWRFGEEAKKILDKVKIINIFRDSLTAVTVDNALYSFDKNSKDLCSVSVRELLPEGGDRNSEIVKNLEIAAQEITKIGAEIEEDKLELEQLKIVHVMLDNKKSLFESKINVSSNFNHGREINLEICNVSGCEIIGKYWRLHLEIKMLGKGCVQNKTFSLPQRFSVQEKMQVFQVLPDYPVKDLPIVIKGRLFFVGRDLNLGVVSSQTLFTQTLNLLDLLQIIQSGETQFPRLPQSCSNRDSFLASLGIQKHLQRTEFSRTVSRELVTQCDFGVLSGMVSVTVTKKSYVTEYTGNRLTVDIELCDSGKILWILGSTDSSLVTAAERDIDGRVNEAGKSEL